MDYQDDINDVSPLEDDYDYYKSIQLSPLDDDYCRYEDDI